MRIVNERYLALNRIARSAEEANDAARAASDATWAHLTDVRQLIQSEFEEKRCPSCRSSWMDAKVDPVITHCPTCRVEQK